MAIPNLTPLGRALRILRIERGWRAKQMAAGIGVSGAFLSAVETGRKPVPADLVERVIRWGSLTPIEIGSLDLAYAATMPVALRVPETMSAEDRVTAVLLARHFARLTHADLEEIRGIIARRIVASAGP